MSARITVVTGGCRSGKSAWAEDLLAREGLPATYIATCPVLDDEMADRVRRHRDNRARRGWDTIEEEVKLADALRMAEGAALVDCLTLWTNNLMYSAECQGRDFNEDDICGPVRQVLSVMKQRTHRTILVTNEVGMGIVPEHPMARRFRDCAGKMTQLIAAEADDVVLIVAGIPLAIKGSLT